MKLRIAPSFSRRSRRIYGNFVFGPWTTPPRKKLEKSTNSCAGESNWDRIPAPPCQAGAIPPQLSPISLFVCSRSEYRVPKRTALNQSPSKSYFESTRNARRSPVPSRNESAANCQFAPFGSAGDVGLGSVPDPPDRVFPMLIAVLGSTSKRIRGSSSAGLVQTFE